ncbi:hypothetical protein H6F76_16085 [Leptolyngbya sp. FACHB-321]|uniref:hypothetical protein n=1 Tax=Leptolyngbya sp. FACHB-321 TaxID=2692807 RepID=UPI0016894A1F|nr:hypothetical protein [Leptolyngbya sp. FACHB-321]MBD2036532.1 hypothetical protein [Leptolyngbya sp. FACHB-321]
MASAAASSASNTILCQHPQSIFVKSTAKIDQSTMVYLLAYGLPFDETVSQPS